ncbi:AzlC family ABC transporter permease [Marinicrinis lubricantis]|uniref:AzlC family ABC transporter permease n=1 Tax=Marinicrinis lubricantis TaxID=2086470 RepID=A0ABW1IK40_9BACL
MWKQKGIRVKLEHTQTKTTNIYSTDDSFLQGIRDCIPTLLGYLSIGFAAGIVGVSTQLSIMEIAMFSALIYAGAAQFIAFALIAASSPITAIIFTTFIVNLRHFLMSLTLAPHFTKYSVLKNIGIGALLTDETFGVAVHRISQEKRLTDRWMNGLNVTAYLMWILSSVWGAVFGKWIENPDMLGFDFALTAMFLALLVLQLQTMNSSKLKHALSLIVYMILVMSILSYLVPTHLAVILSTVIVATIGVVTDR